MKGGREARRREAEDGRGLRDNNLGVAGVVAGAGRGSGKCPPQLPEPRASKVTDTMASSSTKKLAEPPL
eukprot:scaffold82211_cov30-Cyclotella_meneghiniana.AAC.1